MVSHCLALGRRGGGGGLGADPGLGGAGPLEVNVSRFARDNNGQGPFRNLDGGQGLGLSRQVAIGFALTAAILASLALIRSFRALRRSRDLLWREEGWHGLAWTQDELCFRSLEHCLLIPWGELRDLKCFDADEGRFLGDTLWLHLDDKQRVLVAPRTPEGRFAGRTMGEWHLDIKQAWHKATGRHPSSEGGP